MKTPLLLLCLFSAFLLFSGCHKVENTTPRYNKEACLLCAPLGHEADAGKCFNCKGSGVCSFCIGKGKRQVGKEGKFYDEVCAFCEGTGKCHYCTGTGKCMQCKGTGKYVPLTPSVPADYTPPPEAAAPAQQPVAAKPPQPQVKKVQPAKKGAK